MTTETELAHQLERSLRNLPTAPALDYLHTAQRVRRRRRIAVALVVSTSVVALGGAAAAVVGGDDERDAEPAASGVGRERAPAVADPGTLGPDPDYVAPAPANPVEAVDGVRGVDAYTTDEIPSWAEEYGDHGPVAIAPDGRLWVAPDAVIRRTVIDPLGPGGVDADPTSVSYAVEAEFDVPEVPMEPEAFKGDVVWVIVSRTAETATVGEMDEPGRWTDDFELWVDDVTAHDQGRPDFAARLVGYASDRSDVLEPRQGVEIVRQRGDVLAGTTKRSAAAEVRWAGKTWFVVAGTDWIEAYEPADSAPDFAAFIEWARGDLS
ncbi:hypothetical protein [Nocardioides sp. Soil796]|uniref:hypothetical protein n=1 Tax=Nocardioides sp. Soil796 TaxID=1736412 RepID=UPI00070C6CAF|nr:hypothetical protein [Nocardioides sp. Soil796]KRF11961.1 hypothetical protein ASH02_18600 [Nocardioides sp. Soil796]